MADENENEPVEVVDQEEREDENEDEGEEEEEGFLSAEEEFKELLDASQQIEQRFKETAVRLQKTDPGVAEVLRQVAGDVVTLLGEVIAATGAHLDSLDDRIVEIEEGSGPEGLSIDDAKLLYRTLLANNKLWEQVREQALSEQRETITGVMEMNTDAMSRLDELCEEDLPALIQAELEQAESAQRDGTGPSN